MSETKVTPEVVAPAPVAPAPQYVRITGDYFFLVDKDGNESKPAKGWAINGPAAHSPYVPKYHPEYRFQKECFDEMVMWLRNPHNHALWLSGPTGSGKTSSIMELCARTNWPVSSVTCHNRMEIDDLIGRPQVIAVQGQQPQVRFIYGPLSRAMKHGHVLVLNEIDQLNPAQLVGLNDVLEGRNLVINGNGGEVIEPHKNFRIVATANSNGNGNESGAYLGVQTMSVAAMDRFRLIKVDYLPAKTELAILKSVCSKVPEAILESMIKVAEKIRESHLAGSLSAPMSLRTLIHWGDLIVDCKDYKNPPKSALNSAFANRLIDPEFKAVQLTAQQIFGGNDEDWDIL